jgi:hypothetical protein
MKRNIIDEIKKRIKRRINFIKNHNLYPDHGLDAKVEGLEEALMEIEEVIK